MSFCQTKFSPLIRCIALAALFVWVGALARCQTECCSCDEHQSAPFEHHHANATSHVHSHKHSNAPVSQGESSFCLSLKSLFHNSSGLVISKPALQPLYELPSAASTMCDPAPVFVAQHFRQAKPAEWVFTPEVCLGPAFRSLAPPVFSQV